MITKRKLNKKLDLLMARQNFLARILFCYLFTYEGAKKQEKKWNKLWDEIMEEEE